MSITKTRFIQEVLQDEGKRFLRNQGREIRKQLHFHTHDIINERSVSVSSDGSLNGRLSIKLVAYLRLLDSRRNTKRKNGRGVNKRGYRIYNRFAMGHYYGIAFRIQNDFTDEVAADIRRRWQGRRTV